MSHIPNDNVIPLFETFCKKNQIDGKEIDVTLSGKTLTLRVASTPRSQEKGYMHAEMEPDSDCGLLFVYDKPLPLSFWMKHVNFPLDIIFFDSEGNYINHETMPPYNGKADHLIPKHSSKKPARFAVEVKAGWCDKNLTDNCKLTF